LTREDRLVKRIRERHVPITDVRPGLSDDLVAIVDRLLAVHPDDRFRSATEAAEALEALIAPSGGSELDSSAKSGTKKPGAGAKPLSAEPEAPLDWSVIDSALRPAGHRAREAPRLVDRNELKSPSTKNLSSLRKSIEDEGSESGREVHKQYRDELIQMNRVMAEVRSMTPKDEAASAGPTWLERIGEKFGDFVAEPSAGQILIVILLALLILAAALSFALG
jgi:hypothetical protein